MVVTDYMYCYPSYVEPTTPERIIEADAILAAWLHEYNAIWEADPLWHDDGNFSAYFYLCCELADQAYEIAKTYRGDLVTSSRLWRIVDKHMVG